MLNEVPDGAKKKAEIVLNVEQLNAISSRSRQEILDAIRVLGPSTVQEIGIWLHRPIKSVYYPVRCLQQVGLIQVVSRRTAKTRLESIFDLTAERMTLPVNDPESREAIRRQVVNSIRSAERDYVLSTKDSDSRIFLISSIVKLLPVHKEEFLHRLDEALRFAKEHEDSNAEVVAVTLLAIPREVRNRNNT